MLNLESMQKEPSDISKTVGIRLESKTFDKIKGSLDKLGFSSPDELVNEVVFSWLQFMADTKE